MKKIIVTKIRFKQTLNIYITSIYNRIEDIIKYKNVLDVVPKYKINNEKN